MNTTISDRYELGDRLGSGGMSTVYRATDRVLERTVAVKILAEHLSDDDKFVARFRREALAVAKLIHPNSVQVYDTGVDADRHYIVMEYVEGKSVAQLLQTKGRLGADSTTEIGIQACAGLEYAHRQGIIHRDVKPGNLMVIGGPAGRRRRDSSAHEPPTGEMTIKLTDFGIARATAQSRLTQVGSVVGTAAYLAPEQARGEEASPSADVYALGVVLYQLLTGRLPWEGSTLAELAIRRENERPLPPTSYDPDVPETLSQAVLTSLEGEAAARYSSARELSRALEAGLRGEQPAPPSDELPTNMLASPSTAATRRMSSPEPRTPIAPEPFVQRRPPAPSPRPVITPAQARPRRSAAGRFWRTIGILLLIAVLAAIIAGAVLLLTNAGQNTDLGQTIKDNLNDQIQAIEDFVRNNTQ
ncbi:MAG: eukaryotic-like serine/threonine-protein kinase [Solirubrobacterales bacterium]|nr:eukaryotic-like serine/threonine-protein kinase [Solirubrobacterales bacterium]